ncbi:hypothetical protein G6F60_014221 [Rhizopus arrhizus]|nr:hypothetical protein G6F60_014221 [Rhizopus arrhizus]
MRVERVGMDAVVEAIHRHFDGLAQHGAAQPAGEGGQHPDLAARKLQSLPTYRGLARGGVEQQPADTHRLYLHAARPAVSMRGRSDVGYSLPARCWLRRAKASWSARDTR